jgi:DNA-binding MarR family transcriptional regulator
MDIWSNSPHTILSLLLSSTAHKFYISEIAKHTGLARNTVCSILDHLEDAQFVLRDKERFNYEHPNRHLPVYYTLDPRSFHHLRLQAPST